MTDPITYQRHVDVFMCLCVNGWGRGGAYLSKTLISISHNRTVQEGRASYDASYKRVLREPWEHECELRCSSKDHRKALQLLQLIA